MTARHVAQTVRGMPAQDGAGVKLTRLINQPELKQLDPFLLLDQFHSDNPDDYIAGFPPHPHRGFETFTYMLAGSFEHKDSAGGHGLLTGRGSGQWMTAGSGIIHSEMPKQSEGLVQGFQLWINLPASDKMRAPGYQDVQPGDSPVFATDSGATVRLLAGESHGYRGPIADRPTEVYYLDVNLTGKGEFEQALPNRHNAFIYVYRGTLRVGETQAEAGDLLVLSSGESVMLEGMEEGAGALLVAGKPLNEPVVQYGPFVMNSEAEIYQAIRDFQAGKMGTEPA